MSDDSQQNPLRDDTYFLEPVFFKVEGTLFQVPKHLFSEIEVFSTTFTLPPGEGIDVDGSSEGHPFELLGVLKEDFRAFLQAIYPFGLQTHASMTVKQWISVLKLSDMWGFEKAKILAVNMIKSHKAIDNPIQKWLLGERYNVPVWATDGCLELVMRNEDGPQLDEIEKLGLSKALLVENTIFQVPRHHFSESEIFTTMFKLPAAAHVDVEAEGSSETKPLELLGVLGEDFRAFLCALYPLYPRDHESMTPNQWISALKLSDRWGFRTFGDLAVQNLEKSMNEVDPIDRILWGARYRKASWFASGCIGLAKRDDGPSVDDVEKLGTKKALQIYKMREMLIQAQSNPNTRKNIHDDMVNVIQKMYIEAAAELA
ncbi:hypothetical protein HYPSUDRAFT_176537 [Hypholoma sublateritium FD-334 SS-4]|uniref:BTB domain-containing protein n=1 Tax=Hypholoma sublateritium (strain FD-334 SS-4) TaxID=945553 RepID=A0A0D2MXD8_HYPSF|nr:hypothetical protein HYPSUDRAFT_176537 [Hypholoma sublateritium FD-334 SS-4]